MRYYYYHHNLAERLNTVCLFNFPIYFWIQLLIHFKNVLLHNFRIELPQIPSIAIFIF